MFQPRCSICKKIKEETLKDGSSKLERRLYSCAKFVKGGETQSNIIADYDLNPISLSKHLKLHQNPDQNALMNERLEYNIQKRTNTHQDVRDRLKEKGLEALEDGKMTVSANVLRGVAKDEADIEERNKDRSLKMAEMIFAFTSGEQGGKLGSNTDRLTGDDREE